MQVAGEYRDLNLVKHRIIHFPSRMHTRLLASTRRTAQNSLRIDVKIKGAKEGSLYIAQGSVEWWPDYKKVNAHRHGWKNFISLLEDMPKRRSKRG